MYLDKKMKILILFALIFSQSLIIFSQENTENNYFKIGMLFESTSDFVKNEQFNNFLQTNNYYTCSNNISSKSVGLSLRSMSSPSLIHIVFNSGKSLNDKENKTILSSYGVNIDYLYDFIKSDNWLIAPVIGLKINNYKLTAVSVNTTSLLSSLPLEETFQMDNKYMANFGLQLNRKIKISFLDIFVGIKAGYNLNLISENWYNSNQQKINTIPSIGLSGFYWGLSSRFELNLSKVKYLK